MSSWENWEKAATVLAGSSDIPNVPDDLYDAMIQDVSVPETRPDPFNEGRDKTDFYLTWEITSGDVPSGTTLRQYITLPEAYANEGYLSEKSNLYKVMEALGFDLSGKFRVQPSKWQGMEARVMVENKQTRTGEMRPRITAVKPAKKAKAAAAAPAGKKRATDWDDDE